ncbi:DUF423-domain-containing protein [Rhizodiscina lignyota]|uniref:DUF423-domain-containing protein n=1 Tax=Rhizodiscina lignyota TaxID=1504668 RepID=A0A9P4MFH6_9PEZI|nr:DUF423-domain-containing protein [Rhizodiscina lignyota]
MSTLWTIGCIYGGASVVLGAFGAHGLKRRIADPARLSNWNTAAQYQLMHSTALLITSLAPQCRASSIAGVFFTTGMTMFSGSLYLLTLDPQRFKFMGPVTPLGGMCMIGGWIALAFASRGRVRLPPSA